MQNAVEPDGSEAHKARIEHEVVMYLHRYIDPSDVLA